MIRLSFNNEKFNAAFRYALVRLRDAAESVALYRGEKAERHQLRGGSKPVVSNYKRFIYKHAGVHRLELRDEPNVIIPLPWILQARRLFTGQIHLVRSPNRCSIRRHPGRHCRSSATSMTCSPATGPRSSGCTGCRPPMSRAASYPKVTVAADANGVIELDDIEVRNPAGDQLVSDLNLRLEPGNAMIITGKSGSGKSTLLRSLAQLWPYTSGTMHCPLGDNETMFLSELPYVPLGDLRTVVSYPHEPGELSDDVLRQALLARWHCRDTSTGWTKRPTGPRCSPPASSSASRSPGCC